MYLTSSINTRQNAARFLHPPVIFGACHLVFSEEDVNALLYTTLIGPTLHADLVYIPQHVTRFIPALTDCQWIETPGVNQVSSPPKKASQPRCLYD